MIGLLSSGWAVPVLGFLILGLNLILSRLEGDGGPVARTVQVLLIAFSGLLIYSVYLGFVSR